MGLRNPNLVAHTQPPHTHPASVPALDVVQTTSLMPLSAATAMPDSSFRHHHNHHLRATHSNPTLSLPLVAMRAPQRPRTIDRMPLPAGLHPSSRPIVLYLRSLGGRGASLTSRSGRVSCKELCRGSRSDTRAWELRYRSYHANFLQQKQINELMGTHGHWRLVQ